MAMRVFDTDGNEMKVTFGPSYSAGFGFDKDGNVFAQENGEPVDELRAVEIYAHLGGAIGWDLIDAADPRDT